MSIYQSRSKRAADAGSQREPSPAPRHDLTLEGVPVTPEGVAVTPGGVSPPAPPLQNLARLRKATPIEYMLPTSLKWFESLPPEVRPVVLATRYARIANLIAQQWNDERACSAYFDELLKGRRSNRQGFPADVRRELWVLREHFMSVRLKAGGGLAVI
jgi:hypothetical protein